MFSRKADKRIWQTGFDNPDELQYLVPDEYSMLKEMYGLWYEFFYIKQKYDVHRIYRDVVLQTKICQLNFFLRKLKCRKRVCSA